MKLGLMLLLLPAAMLCVALPASQDDDDKPPLPGYLGKAGLCSCITFFTVISINNKCQVLDIIVFTLRTKNKNKVIGYICRLTLIHF
jgi:hypothetical protein